MKNTKWNDGQIIGNKKEAVEQIVSELKTAYNQIENGYITGGLDSIECALNRLGIERKLQSEIDAERREQIIKMNS